MRRHLEAVGWDVRMILGSRRVAPHGPLAWLRFRVLDGIRLRRDGFTFSETFVIDNFPGLGSDGDWLAGIALDGDWPTGGESASRCGRSRRV